jgi:transposase
MTKATRGCYTLEFKQEAVRLVEASQTMAAVSRSVGVVEQTLGNWIKLHRAGALKGASGKQQASAEQMEFSRLRAGLARVTMERDILGKATAFYVLRKRSP